MILSTHTGRIASRMCDKEAIRIIAEAGFDAFDYSVSVHGDDSPVYGENYKEYVAELMEVAEKYHIPCNQAHAHYPSNIWGDEEYNEKAFWKVTRSMEIASIMGAKIIVVHPLTDYPNTLDEEKVMQMNLDFFNRLLPYCKQYNIKVAVENIYMHDERRKSNDPKACSFAKELAYYLDQLDSEWFVACLDLGHCGVVGEETDHAIRVLGKKRLQALHVHDNNYEVDQHYIPYRGQMDWDKIYEAFAEIGYEGDFTFETSTFLRGFPEDFLVETVGFMEKLGRYMIRRIEELKGKQNG